MLTCTLPLNEILVDFNDKLKSMTRGYGSMDYEHAGYRAAKLVKMDMLISGEPVDAFSTIVHKEKALARGRHLAAKLKGGHPPPDVHGGHPGGNRRQHHRPRNDFGDAEKRHRQMLRRRHFP